MSYTLKVTAQNVYKPQTVRLTYFKTQLYQKKCPYLLFVIVASNPRFLYEEDGQVCASDIHVVYTIYGLAWIFMTVAYILKKTDRRPRVGGRRGAAARPHLD